MAIFTASTHAEAIVLAEPEEIWAALTDPDLVAEMTPFLARIEADGEHWRWFMSGFDVLGKTFRPEFTERMVFDEPTRIEFHHDPPAETERSGVQGWYELTPVPEAEGGGTRLVTDLTICLDLPLPKVAKPAVTKAMHKVIDTMGDTFSERLLKHLGTTERTT